MKCSNCGVEFNEGIFCPECGTRNDNENADATSDFNVENEKADVEKAKATAEKAKAEAEKIKADAERVKAEAERAQAAVEREKAEVEKIKKAQANLEKEDFLNRTVRGTVYKTMDEAELAKKEHNMLDVLISQLVTLKSQKQRQGKFGEFNVEINTVDVKNRYELLKAKIMQKQPLSEKANAIYGVSVAIALVAWILGVLMDVDVETSTWLLITFMWSGAGLVVWPIWKIILFVKSRSKDYYKNIKKI